MILKQTLSLIFFLLRILLYYRRLCHQLCVMFFLIIIYLSFVHLLLVL